MKIFLTIQILLLVCLCGNAFARTCEVSKSCYPTWVCVTKYKRMTWAQFEAWLNETANQGRYWEALLTTTTYIYFIYDESCNKPILCYDNLGECDG